jgi:hypothetical protein
MIQSVLAAATWPPPGPGSAPGLTVNVPNGLATVSRNSFCRTQHGSTSEGGICVWVSWPDPVVPHVPEPERAAQRSPVGHPSCTRARGNEGEKRERGVHFSPLLDRRAGGETRSEESDS